MARIVVETTYDPPVTDQVWDELNQKAMPCLEARQIRWIRSLVSQDRRRSVCELDAVDAETVRDAYRRASVPFDRIWTAEILAAEE